MFEHGGAGSRRIIDEHGEIVAEIRPGDRVVRRESINYLKRTSKSQKEQQFAKVFLAPLKEIIANRDLSLTAKTVMLVLVAYVDYGGLLCRREAKNALSNKDIQAITGLSKATVSKAMTELERHRIIVRQKAGRSWHYYVNPYIVCKGRDTDKALVAMFDIGIVN